MVFQSFDRVDLNYSQNSEGIYKFLNRSALPQFAEFRQIINEWFSHFPEEHKKELSSRLRDDKDEQFQSAFFELYIHEILLKYGYSVKIHQKINEDDFERPDFLVKKDEEEFFLEAVLSNENSVEERKAQVRLANLVDKLNEIESSKFFISISPIGYVPLSFKISKIKLEIQEFIKNLDYESVLSVYKTSNLDKLPTWKKDFDEFHLEITVFPKLVESKKFVLIQNNEARFDYIEQRIRNTIRRKIKAYKKLDKPFLLAINTIAPSCSVQEIIDALFGTEQLIFESHKKEEPKFRRKRDGVFLKNDNQRLSGVLLTTMANPWGYLKSDLTLYLNPGAKYPYSGDLLKLPNFTPEQGVLKFIDGDKPRDILGLASNY
ncbi:MAG: hypothetical protein CVU46_10065 [Chloroflexi bacterium HGW-Chloroflexi-8]|nr:MAG: hypothetical protein CVU46_10065 [Chloroflexi bacterium HGW-Chloroflexi-8]